MASRAPAGAEALRVTAPDEVPLLNDWVHDAYLEPQENVSDQDAEAVIPFAQESGWVFVQVQKLDVRVLVASEGAGRIQRKVLRGWPIESDRRGGPSH